MSILKNVSLATVDIDDLGYSIDAGETLDTLLIPSDDIARSIDLATVIDSGSIVVWDEQLNQPLSIAESKLTIQKAVDLSLYYTSDVIVQLIEQAKSDAIASALSQFSGGSAVNNVDSLVKLPLAHLNNGYIKFGSWARPRHSEFWDELPCPYYNNAQTTSWQTIADVNGSGILGGILMPQLDKDNGSNREITIKVTVDGVVYEETLYMDYYNNKNCQIYYGTMQGTDRGKTGTSGMSILRNDENDVNSFYTNHRPQKSPITANSSDVHLLHPTLYQMNANFPRIPFNTSLSVEYQCNLYDVFSDSSYKRRCCAIYLLGDVI